MTIGNLGTGITLSSLASEWGQPATNVKLGDYTADRTTTNADLFITVTKETWSDSGPYQTITGSTTSGVSPPVTRTYFKFNSTQLEMGVTWGDSISDASGTYNAPDGRHIFSSFGSSSLGGGPNSPAAYNANHASTRNGNTRMQGLFALDDGDIMNEQRDGQGPFRGLDVKRFVHPVQNQATGGNLAYTYINNSNSQEVTNEFNASSDYCMLNFPILYVTKRTRKIYFALNSSVDIPFYICTTPNSSGSNLATGVTNNGAVYNASSQFWANGYTWVILDLQTANFPNTSGVTPTFINGASPNYYFPEHASDKTTASNYATVNGPKSVAGRWQSGDKTNSTSDYVIRKNTTRMGRLNSPGTGIPVGQGNTGQDPTTWNMLWVCSNQELMSQSWFYASKLGSEVPTYPAGGLPNSSSVPLHADIASVRTPLAINLIPYSNPAGVTKANKRPMWKFNFTGTGGTEYSPASYFPLAPYPTSSDVGIIKNGQTGYARQTCTSFSPLASGGSVLYSVIFYYPINYTSPGGGPGLGLGQGWNTGPYASVNVRGDNGSTAGGNYVGGSGNYGNNGPDVAAYWANNNSNSFTFGGTPFPGSTNIAVNYSRSGAVLTVALTNNTGQDIYWSNTNSANGGMFGMAWYNGSSYVYGNQSGGLWGSGHQARAIDTNAYSKLAMYFTDEFSTNYSWTTYVYHTPGASPSTVASELANRMNNFGGPNSSPSYNSQFPPGGNQGDGSGILNGNGIRGYASGANLYVYRNDGDNNKYKPQTASPGPSVRTEYYQLATNWDPLDLGGVGGNISATTSAPNGYVKSIMPALNTGAQTYGWRQSNTNLPISNVKFGVRLGDFANCVNAGTDGT